MNLHPLYLEAGFAWEVRLDAGVALHVSAPGRARSLYPLRKLARVVCGTQASWDTSALVACLQAGVPVVFHDGQGAAAAWCFGPRRRETTLEQLLREGLGRPEWRDRFEAWRHAACRREALGALAYTNVHSHRLDAPSVRSRLANLHRLRLGFAAGPWLHALQRVADGLAAEAVQQAIGDPALIGYASPGLNLAAELGALLEWQFHRLLHDATPQALLAQTPGRFAATVAQSRGAPLHRACGDLLGDLERQLRDWLL